MATRILLNADVTASIVTRANPTPTDLPLKAGTAFFYDELGPTPSDPTLSCLGFYDCQPGGVQTFLTLPTASFGPG